MNDTQIQCFLAVAEHLNFARAAEVLHVTQPAVTQQIQSLEKELGVRLFARTTRTVRLTQEGRLFLQDARQLSRIARRAKGRFRHDQPREILELAVGCDNYPCLFAVAQALGTLRRAHPQLHPQLQAVPFPHIYRMLEEGDLDAVVGFRKTGEVRGMVYRELTRLPLVCICPAGHPLEGRETVTLEELAREKLVLLSPEQALPQVARLQGRLLENKTPEDCYVCSSGEAMVVLVSGGYGVSVLPDLMVPDSFGLGKIPLAGLEPASFGLYYRTLQGKPLVRELAAALGQALPPCVPGGSGVQ